MSYATGTGLPLQKIWNELDERRSIRLLVAAGATHAEAINCADTSWRSLPARLRNLIREVMPNDSLVQLRGGRSYELKTSR